MSPSFVAKEALQRYGSLLPYPVASSDDDNAASMQQLTLTSTSISDIDLDDSLVIFVSNQTLTNGKSDREDNARFSLLMEGVEKIHEALAPGVSTVYLWIDSLCSPRDASSSSSSKRPAMPPPSLYLQIFEVVDIMLTIIYDPEIDQKKSPPSTATKKRVEMMATSGGERQAKGEIVNGGNKKTGDAPYTAKPWNFGPLAYLNGAKCRLDMIYNSIIAQPVHSDVRKLKLSKSYLKLPNILPTRPHMIFGSYESANKLPPLVLPMHEMDFFVKNPPIKGKLSDQEDRRYIMEMMDAIKPRIIKSVQDAAILSEVYNKTPDELAAIHTNNSLNTYAMVDSSDNFETGDSFSVWRDVYSGRLGENVNDMVEQEDGSFYIGEIKQNGDVGVGSVVDPTKKVLIKEGKGVQRFNTGAYYEGNFFNNEFHGDGKYTYADRTVYEGEFFQGEIHGRGKVIYHFGDIYEGFFTNGERSGYGILHADDGIYEGMFKADDFHGQGSYKYKDGSIYVGEWKCGLYHGLGARNHVNGESYTGFFEKGYMHGKGKYTYSNGDTYEGDFWKDMSHGKGIYCSIEGDVYEGEYRNDKRHGKGKLKAAMGGIFSGTWTNGRKDRSSPCVVT